MCTSVEPGAIEALSENIVNARFEDLDRVAVEEAKKRIIDVLGCLIGGANAPGNKPLIDLAKNWGGKEECTIFVHGGKAPAQNAAMVNTIMARSYDFEVMSYVIEDRTLPSHHAATLVPTALALSEAGGLSGRELIMGMLLGEDVAARVQAASAGHPIYLGWDGCGTLSHLGATATAGRLLGLNGHQVKMAFGIVLNTIASAIQSLWDGATTFKLGQGIAARNGIFSAELAKAGWTGAEDALQSRFGYFFLYAGGCKDPGILTRNLGKKYYAESYFKPYPCGMPNHPAIDAALTLAARYDIEPQNIQDVIIHVPKGSIGRSYYAKPFVLRGFPHGDAIFSYPYTVATALMHKRCNLYNFTEEAIRDPEVIAITARTTLLEQDEVSNPGMGIRVQVKMKDGRDFSEIGSAPRDWATRPTPKEEILAKFWHQIDFSNTISREKAGELLHQIDNLETVDNLTPLLKLLVV